MSHHNTVNFKYSWPTDNV